MLSHDGKSREASAAFAKVVALSPEDLGAREDLLWARVDAGLEKEPRDDGDDGKPDDDAGARLAAALQKHDRAAVRDILAKEGGALTSSEQIDAARELGDDERAWALVKAAPMHSGDADEDAAVAEHRRDLAEQRLSGAWATGGVQALGPLDIFQEKARAAARLGRFGFELLAEHAHLDAAADALVSEIHADEWRGGAALTLQEPWGDTRLEGGAYSLPTGALPYLAAVQRWTPTERIDLELEGLYHQLPTDSAALRIAGLRDAVEAEAAWRMGAGFALAGAVGASRYTARDGGLLANGWFGRAEAVAHLRPAIVPAAPARRRVCRGEQSGGDAAGQPGAAGARAACRAATCLPSSYQTTGVGLTLLRRRGDDEEEPGSGKGCAPCFRPFGDVWTGWLMPAQRLTFSFEAGLGFLFLQHQELSAAGFYYTDYHGESGQRYTGALALVHVEVAVRAVEETPTPAPPPTATMASAVRGRRARPKWAWISAWIESAVLAGLVPLAGAWVSRRDPLFVHAAFPWSAIAPLIAGVRYGFGAGFGCAVLVVFTMLGAWQHYLPLPFPAEEFPMQLSVGLLIVGMVAGEFSDLSKRRLHGLETEQEQLRRRFDGFARTYQALRLSHDLLESRVAGATSTVREGLRALADGFTRGPTRRRPRRASWTSSPPTAMRASPPSTCATTTVSCRRRRSASLGNAGAAARPPADPRGAAPQGGRQRDAARADRREAQRSAAGGAVHRSRRSVARRAGGGRHAVHGVRPRDAATDRGARGAHRRSAQHRARRARRRTGGGGGVHARAAARAAGPARARSAGRRGAVRAGGAHRRGAGVVAVRRAAHHRSRAGEHRRRAAARRSPCSCR